MPVLVNVGLAHNAPSDRRSPMHVTLIGAGRLGRSLDILLREAGHDTALLQRGNTVGSHTDVIVLTVPDTAIADVARGLDPGGPVVLHTSGATDLTPLQHLERHGSLHPLMTFPGPEVGMPDLQGVPAAVAGTPEGLRMARELAGILGLRAVEVPGDRRLYHAAAVMAGNFATVLMGIAAEALVAAGVDQEEASSMLVPIATESIHNATQGVAAALTGPIARGDQRTLDAHRDALSQAGLKHLLGWYDDQVDQARRFLSQEPPST